LNKFANPKSDIRNFLMFTGIIEELGRVREVQKRGEDARMVIEAGVVTEDIHEGDQLPSTEFA